MFATPTIAEVLDVGARFGIDLAPAEAEAFQALLVRQLAMLDAFAQSRQEEYQPPRSFPDRSRGQRPTDDQDPYGAWLWQCSVGGREDGLLAGRTVSFKGHIAIAGVPLSFNTFALDDLVPDFDATVVHRVLEAGGQVVGLNTHHGFTGMRGVGGHVGDYWEARNPIDPTRAAGGSSSGCAAAVAAGQVDIAFGGDQGGSIRQPAAYCGIVGLKPTFGLVSHMGATYGSDFSIDHIGPMARTVGDVAAALDAVAGFDGLDPRQGREVPERIDSLRTLYDGVDGLRIGILDEAFDEPMEPGVRDGVLEALEVFRQAGAEVTPVSIPAHRAALVAADVLQFDGYLAAHEAGPFGTGARTYYPASIVARLDEFFRTNANLLATYLKFGLISGELSRRNFHGVPYARAQNMRPIFVKAYDDALRDVDVLAMPTCPNVARPLPEELPVDQGRRREIELLADGSIVASYRDLRQFGYTGHPALALPCGKHDGLPISLHLVGRFFEDALLLRVAYAYEHAAHSEQPGSHPS